MANDNKKINDLVSEDDDTSELEVLTATVVFDPDFDYEAESDAATHSFETSSLSAGAGAGNESIAALKSDLRQRDESIGSLQYDIEELRARWTGLEKELKAREELTDNVTRELEQSNRKLAQTISLLRKRDTKVAALETTLGQQAARLTEADSSIEQARLDTESLQAEIAALEDRDAAAAGTIELLNAELNDEKSKRKQAEDAGHAQHDRTRHLEYQHDESRSSLATLQQYIEGRKERWEKQEADLKARRRSFKEQRKEIVRLGREARVTAEQLRKMQSANQKANVERDDLQANLERVRAEARELRTALTEKAESQQKQQDQVAALVQQLDGAASAVEQEKAHRQKVALELADGQQQLRSLQAELTALQAASAEKEVLTAELQQKIEEAALASEQEKVARRSVELELAEGQQQLSSLNAELGSLHAELTAMQAASAEKETLIADRQQQIDELSEQMESAVGRLADVESRRADLEEQLEHSRKQAELLQKDYDDLSAEATKNEQLASDQARDVIDLNRELKSATDRLEGEQSDHQALMLKYETLQDEATQLRAELRPLRDAVAKAEALEKAHAGLSGLLSGNEDKIRDLRNQIAKTEGYADVLRMKLQQHLAESEALKSEHSEAQASLAAALERVSDLTTRLDAEQRLSAELKEKNEDAEKRLAEEIRIIRFELDAAQETVAESQTLNEQLTSNLIESKSFRRTLENQLTEADESRNKNIKDLSKQLAQLKQQIDDYERKISTKDAAINALLTELAHKPDAPSENAPDVVHRLADRKPHGADEKGSHDRDRVTRLLIGNIDGQELRFPLFKDKLTIGRTVHNDIQLKAQYVSRRHAVVVTDEDCTRIVDWGSKNGIYVNGKRVTEQVLRNNDRVTVGTAEFKFEERPKR